MKNWRTTISGALGSLGTTIAGASVFFAMYKSDDFDMPPAVMKYCVLAGFAISALGKFFGMLFAADAANLSKNEPETKSQIPCPSKKESPGPR